MALKVTNSSETLEVTSTQTLITGDPGSGKTSVASTASNCGIFDFNDGAHRSAQRADVLRIDEWEDTKGSANEKVIGEFIKNHDTLAIDTIRDMQTLILTYAGKKYKDNRQVYGLLIKEVDNFLNKIKAHGKDTVIIAHYNDEMIGNTKFKFPDIDGKTYRNILSKVDSVCNLVFDEDATYIDFNATKYYYGKNPAGFEKTLVPDLNENPNYYANLTSNLKKRLGNISENHRQSIDKIEGFKISVFENATDPDSLNGFVAEMIKWPQGEIKQVWQSCIMVKANELNLVFNAETKRFTVNPEKPKEEAKEEKQTSAETEKLKLSDADQEKALGCSRGGSIKDEPIPKIPGAFDAAKDPEADKTTKQDSQSEFKF